MDYEVTATRKRPRSFDALVGQEFVVASLKNSMQSGRIAHAYLFSGPRGVGKTSAARILARALNCPGGPTADSCDDYPGSDEIAHGTAIDVIEIDGASNTSVNDVRQIKDEVLFAPTTSRYKIYIIDEVHMLSNSAFNALLKTIEEPPPYIVFIFATTEIHKVPATIRSRCQQFNFRLIPVDDICDLLTEVAQEMSVEADREALFWIAKEATGSLRDAYTLYDQIVSFSDGHITLEKIREKLGLVGLDELNEIADALAEGDEQAIVELTDSILAQGVSIEQLVIDLTEYFRSILFIRKGIHKESLLGFAPDRFSGKLIKTLSNSQVEHALELLLGLYRAIRYSLNQRFDLDLVMSKLSGLRDHLTSAEILAQVQELRDIIVEGPDPAVAGSDDPPETGPESRSPRPAQTSDDDQPQRQSPQYQHSQASDLGPQANPNGPSEPTEDPPVADSAMPAPAVAEQSATPHSAGQPVDSAQVTEIIGLIQPAKLALGSALEKAINWILKDSELIISFDSEYPVSHARGEEEIIRRAAAEVLGKPVLVRLNVVGAPEKSSDQEDQSDLVQHVFRGEIVDG